MFPIKMSELTCRMKYATAGKRTCFFFHITRSNFIIKWKITLMLNGKKITNASDRLTRAQNLNARSLFMLRLSETCFKVS
jgi:hypothetical protein